MKRALLATLVLAAGCRLINGGGDPDTYYPPPPHPFKCDAGEVVIVDPAPYLKCAPADGGTDSGADASSE